MPTFISVLCEVFDQNDSNIFSFYIYYTNFKYLYKIPGTINFLCLIVLRKNFTNTLVANKY